MYMIKNIYVILCIYGRCYVIKIDGCVNFGIFNVYNYGFFVFVWSGIFVVVCMNYFFFEFFYFLKKVYYLKILFNVLFYNYEMNFFRL